MGIEPLGERPVRLAEREDHLRIVHRRLDLEPVPDDPGIGHEAGFVAGTETSHDLRVEVAVRRAESFPLLKDREPGEPRLVDLQDQSLEELGILPAGEAILPVVVGTVEGVAGAK